MCLTNEKENSQRCLLHISLLSDGVAFPCLHVQVGSCSVFNSQTIPYASTPAGILLYPDPAPNRGEFGQGFPGNPQRNPSFQSIACLIFAGFSQFKTPLLFFQYFIKCTGTSIGFLFPEQDFHLEVGLVFQISFHLNTHFVPFILFRL